MFTGREYDWETGLYNYRNRMYDPAIGRFTTEDPIGFNGGDLNLYRYVGNSPQMFRDPDGLVPVPVITGIAGAVGAAAIATVHAATTGNGLGAEDAGAIASSAIVGGLAGVGFGLVLPAVSSAATGAITRIAAGHISQATAAGLARSGVINAASGAYFTGIESALMQAAEGQRGVDPWRTTRDTISGGLAGLALGPAVFLAPGLIGSIAAGGARRSALRRLPSLADPRRTPYQTARRRYLGGRARDRAAAGTQEVIDGLARIGMGDAVAGLLVSLLSPSIFFECGTWSPNWWGVAANSLGVLPPGLFLRLIHGTARGAGLGYSPDHPYYGREYDWDDIVAGPGELTPPTNLTDPWAEVWDNREVFERPPAPQGVPAYGPPIPSFTPAYPERPMGY